MSLHPQGPATVPEETRRVARAAFPKGTLCLRIADALGPIYQDTRFAALFPRRGQPAAAPGRIDWKGLARAGGRPAVLRGHHRGPGRRRHGWQARVECGLTKAAFRVDRDCEVATCPAGKESISWPPHTWPRPEWRSRPGSRRVRTASRARCGHA